MRAGTARALAALFFAGAFGGLPGGGSGALFAEEAYADAGGDVKGITVTGTKESTQQMKVIEKEAIEKRNARDLAALLEEELDMSVTRFGAYGSQTDLNLRGFDTERIAILIDGVPANSPHSGEFDVNQVDLANVERIEVIYGGSDTKYNVSGALGGVINIITVKKQPAGFRFGGTLSNTGYMPGQYNARHSGGKIAGAEYADLADMQSLSLFAGCGGEGFSWKTSLFGNYAGNHYLYQDDYGFARRKTASETLDAGGNAAFVWDLPAGATLLSDSKFYYARRSFPVTMNSTGSAEATDTRLGENLLLNAPRAFRDDLAAEASLSYQTSISSYGVDTSSFDHYITAINRWNWYPAEKFTARAGADWRFLYINSESATETEPVKTGNQGGMYLTGEWKPHNRFLLIASVKGSTDTRQAVAVPKLGLSWAALDGLVLKNNYYRSFKFPDFDDLYYRSPDIVFAGNPDLKPEDGWGADFCAELSAGGLFTLESAVYGQYTRDSIHWVKSAGGRWSPENVGVAWFTGFDVRPKLTFAVNKLGVRTLKIGASYQLQYSWLLSRGGGFAESFRIPYMPTHIIGGSLDLSWASGSLLVSAHYESTRYADTLNEMAIAPYCVVNATVNQNAGKAVAFFLSLRNILNAHYESFASYYMPGFSFTVGVRSSWTIEK